MMVEGAVAGVRISLSMFIRVIIYYSGKGISSTGTDITEVGLGTNCGNSQKYCLIKPQYYQKHVQTALRLRVTVRYVLAATVQSRH